MLLAGLNNSLLPQLRQFAPLPYAGLICEEFNFLGKSIFKNLRVGLFVLDLVSLFCWFVFLFFYFFHFYILAASIQSSAVLQARTRTTTCCCIHDHLTSIKTHYEDIATGWWLPKVGIFRFLRTAFHSHTKKYFAY